MTQASQTEAPPTFTTECPPWCTLPPGHRVDGIIRGRSLRSHAGPEDFGPFISVSADESLEDQGTLRRWVTVTAYDDNIDDPALLRDLASQVLAAAAWLEGDR